MRALLCRTGRTLSGPRRRAGAIALALLAWSGPAALADQGGVSFWLPGQYASFAAVAPDPGWSLPVTTYSYSGSAGVGVTLPRGNLAAYGVSDSLNQVFLQPSYTLDTTVLGARPSFSVAIAPGCTDSTANTQLGPLSESRSGSLFGLGNLAPTASLFWPAGVHNFMVYVTGVVLRGDYNPNRLPNLGIGHPAIDGGGSYTYYDTKAGTEFSATLGFTKNFENTTNNYTNGVDCHLDLAASQFLTDAFFVGVVGYYYQQLTADHGQPPVLGSFESRVRGAGPQIG